MPRSIQSVGSRVSILALVWPNQKQSLVLFTKEPLAPKLSQVIKPDKTKYNLFKDLHDDFLLTSPKIVKFPRLTFRKDILILCRYNPLLLTFIELL